MIKTHEEKIKDDKSMEETRKRLYDCQGCGKYAPDGENHVCKGCKCVWCDTCVEEANIGNVFCEVEGCNYGGCKICVYPCLPCKLMTCSECGSEEGGEEKCCAQQKRDKEISDNIFDFVVAKFN